MVRAGPAGAGPAHPMVPTRLRSAGRGQPVSVTRSMSTRPGIRLSAGKPTSLRVTWTSAGMEEDTPAPPCSR